MTRTKTTSAAALLVSAALLLAGCGGQADDTAASGDAGASSSSPSASAPSSAPQSTASASDVAPATGELITGTGYSFSVPEGWTIPEQQIPGTEQLDVFVADLSDPNAAFADNVNVVVGPDGQVVTPESIEAEGVEQLKAQTGAADVAVGSRTVIAGTESAHITATVTEQGATYNVDQFYPTTDDRTYVVTFSFNTDVSDADRAAVYESVLASWAWA
ncbi:hypothetical protein [Microbacterium sp. cf332]|uniref:hypothetical protein n=1 Tax=Microbacterium sp. cf332 TaxID=1761804 RepID=UPI00089127F7|nr:hypothetical protein [Microbacterium sp. cf332]SDQ45564.1 hypothetical protein SAMN04487847_1479 [Microbacterium sp. cf332]